jgi:hypothetical protein
MLNNQYEHIVEQSGLIIMCNNHVEQSCLTIILNNHNELSCYTIMLNNHVEHLVEQSGVTIRLKIRTSWFYIWEKSLIGCRIWKRL